LQAAGIPTEQGARCAQLTSGDHSKKANGSFDRNQPIQPFQYVVDSLMDQTAKFVNRTDKTLHFCIG
jgi:hypothetical protein